MELGATEKANQETEGHEKAGPDGRAMRADARRNYERLLEAARKVFADQGGGASMEAIAKQAGGLILPAYESQWKNDFWKSDPNFAQLEGQVRDPSGYNQQYYPGPVSAGVDGVFANKVLEDMMAAIIRKGQKVPDAVKDADDQMRKIFEQFGFKQ